MPVLDGLSGAPMMTPTRQTPSGPTMAPSTTIPAVIDGTPVRVITLALAAALGLVALHAAGFRFNVGVSG